MCVSVCGVPSVGVFGRLVCMCLCVGVCKWVWCTFWGVYGGLGCVCGVPCVVVWCIKASLVGVYDMWGWVGGCVCI